MEKCQDEKKTENYKSIKLDSKEKIEIEKEYK